MPLIGLRSECSEKEGERDEGERSSGDSDSRQISTAILFDLAAVGKVRDDRGLLLPLLLLLLDLKPTAAPPPSLPVDRGERNVERQRAAGQGRGERGGGGEEAVSARRRNKRRGRG